jgi:hypothetical protein
MYIYIEDIADLGGLELHLSYPPASMTADAMMPESVLSSSSFFYDTINSTTGTIELISTASNFTGYNGSGALAKINFIAGSTVGIYTLQINDTSILKNSENVQIDCDDGGDTENCTIVDRVHGLIKVIE